MAEYTVYAKMVVRFETPRNPSQIKAALNNASPALRDAFKQLWRDQFAKGPMGASAAIEWHYHSQGWSELTGVELDLDDGLPTNELE